MAYFPDLSRCTYFSAGDDEEPRLPPLVAVGWLDAEHPFATGDPGRKLFEKLKALRDMKWEPFLFLGGHYCDLCRYDQFCSHKDLRHALRPAAAVTCHGPVGGRRCAQNSADGTTASTSKSTRSSQRAVQASSAARDGASMIWKHRAPDGSNQLAW